LAKAKTLAPLLKALRDLVSLLQAEQVSGILVGGVAASLLGRPRLTRDVDAIVLLREEHWERFLSTAARFGFALRRPDALAFARQARVLLLRHEPSGIEADVVVAGLPFEEEAIGRAVWVDFEGVRLPLPTVEDLIIMKAVANRPRDLADIEALLDAQRNLDVRRVRRWVREFSTALAMPHIIHDLEVILNQRRRKRKDETQG